MNWWWICPSLCDVLLIQKPFVYDDEETIPGIILQTSHCPLCGKHMSIILENSRTSRIKGVRDGLRGTNLKSL